MNITFCEIYTDFTPKTTWFQLRFEIRFAPGENHGVDFRLLYKELQTGDPISENLFLSMEDPDIRWIDFRTEGNTVRRSADFSPGQLGLPGKLCAMAICPIRNGMPVEDARSNTRIVYLGEPKHLFWSAEPRGGSATELTLRSEWELSPRDLRIRIGDTAFPLPFTVDAEPRKALFFTQLMLDTSAIELQGAAKYICTIERENGHA